MILLMRFSAIQRCYGKIEEKSTIRKEPPLATGEKIVRVTTHCI